MKVNMLSIYKVVTNQQCSTFVRISSANTLLPFSRFIAYFLCDVDMIMVQWLVKSGCALAYVTSDTAARFSTEIVYGDSTPEDVHLMLFSFVSPQYEHCFS